VEKLPNYHQLLHYDAHTGEFRWRDQSGGCSRNGGVAGSLDRYGYRQISVRGRGIYAHRLAWFFYTGDWPTFQIDHINGVRDDNRIANLRPATCSENQQNVAKRAGATSKLMGVTWHKGAKKWHSKIQSEGKQFSLGYYDTEEAAHSAYLRAKAELHQFNPVVRPANGPSA